MPALPRPALVALVALVGLIAACSSSPDTPAAPPAETPDARCSAGRVAVDGACELDVSKAPCAPGTRPVVGSPTCAPVGVSACAPGFERDATGWGCVPVLPDAVCTDATRDALGDKTCRPVGDCAAPFPPAGAITVDPSLADGAIDATHVRRLDDAAIAVNDGKTLALADGAHEVDDLLLAQRFTIVGRCPAKARIVGAAGNPLARGLRVGAAVTIRGVTLSGLVSAVSVGAPGALTLEDAVVQDAKYRGVLVDRASSATITRSVIRGTSPRSASDQTIALIAGAGSVVTVTDSALLDNADGALVATDGPGTRIDVTRSVIREVRTRSDGVGGSAVRAFEDARVSLTESAIVRARGVAILALRRKKPPPEVTVVRSVVTDTLALLQGERELATAVNAGPDAIVKVDDSTVRDTAGFGVYGADGSTVSLTKTVVLRSKRNKDQLGYAVAAHASKLSLEDSAVVDSGSVAVSAYRGGAITFTRSGVFGSGGEERDGFPLGFGLAASDGSSIVARDGAVVGATEIGASVNGAGGTLVLAGMYIGPRGAKQGKYAHGVLAVYQATATVTGSIVEGHAGAALLVAGGAGIAATSDVRDNAVAVQVQEGSALDETDAAPESATATTLTVVRDTVFARNATRVGAGALPLPAPIVEQQN